MIPGEAGPSLRDRVMDAMDTESVSQRIKALVELMEEYAGEQARIGYRQGYESAELNNRDQLERAHGLIRKLTPELFVAEATVERVRDVLAQYDTGIPKPVPVNELRDALRGPCSCVGYDWHGHCGECGCCP